MPKINKTIIRSAYSQNSLTRNRQNASGQVQAEITERKVSGFNLLLHNGCSSGVRVFDFDHLNRGHHVRLVRYSLASL